MIKELPDMSYASMFEIKPFGDGRYILEAYGFESMPFELSDLRSNKEWFSKTINSVVQGTVQ